MQVLNPSRFRLVAACLNSRPWHHQVTPLTPIQRNRVRSEILIPSNRVDSSVTRVHSSVITAPTAPVSQSTHDTSLDRVRPPRMHVPHRTSDNAKVHKTGTPPTVRYSPSDEQLTVDAGDR